MSTFSSVKTAGIPSYSGAVKIWLLSGVVMIFFQVVVGGITRLTGSGLSITRWEIITGTLPPMSEQGWNEAFDLYKATPQYEKINEGMSMSEFKFIYFWEYIHRLWARLMGFVFIFPFVFFLWKKQFDPPLLRRLVVVFLLAALVASFGWIMVASGFIERPWVNAYKLTMHLSLAFICYAYLLWTAFKVYRPQGASLSSKTLNRSIGLIVGLLALQIILGGTVSGMRAALLYPTWPDMQGQFIPEILLQGEAWNWKNFINYDSNAFMSAFVQFFHRNIGYLISLLILLFVYRLFKTGISGILKKVALLMLGMLIIQVLLGIFTLINSIGIIPVSLGVLHQAGALVLLSLAMWTKYLITAE